LVNWIPIVGGLVGLYGLYLAVVGIREKHSTLNDDGQGRARGALADGRDHYPSVARGTGGRRRVPEPLRLEGGKRGGGSEKPWNTKIINRTKKETDEPEDLAIDIVGALVFFLLVAPVVGLVIGNVIGAVIDRDGGLRVRTEQPTSVGELRDSYALETGSLEVNLQDLELPQGTTDVKAAVYTGALTVVCPRAWTSRRRRRSATVP
jgi:hypothetical protein